MRELTITIPWTPPHILSPNASRSVHWGAKTKAKNDAKHAAYYAALAERSRLGITMPLDGNIPYRLVIGWESGRKKQDDDNIVSSVKWARDAVCDALGIDDVRLRLTGVEQVQDPAGIGFTRFIFGEHRDADAA